MAAEVTTLWSSSNMGPDAGGFWQIGDINGDGKAEVLLIRFKGRWVITVYGWNGSAMTTLWSSRDIGQESIVAWLIGDINRDGKAEIIQLTGDPPLENLGITVWGWNGSAMTTLWSSPNMGQGAGAVVWLIGDINGDGKAEIIQQWANGGPAGSLGTIVYGWNGSAMTTLWSSGNMGQGPGAVAWLIGDINGNGKAEIIQEWANGASLGTIVYGHYSSLWNSNAMTTLWSSANMGQGPGAVNGGWLIGDLTGNGKAEIIQEWANGGPAAGGLGTTVYGYRM